LWKQYQPGYCFHGRRLDGRLIAADSATYWDWVSMLAQQPHRRARFPQLVKIVALCILPLAAWAFELGTTEPTIAAKGSDPGKTARYAGDAACTRCHAAQGRFYENTPHRLTLQLASNKSILGSFARGSNTLETLDPKSSLLGDGLIFEMQRTGNHSYQIAKRSEIHDLDNTTVVTERKERIDLVTGSGVRGQSYLYWKDDELYELPISYWSKSHEWINSPGYPQGSAIFDRPVYPRCLECHTTFVQAIPGEGHENRYVASTLIPGITCERCHGPGLHHVELEKAAGKERSETILNPRHFTRDRQVDLCALCHNGVKREATQPAFSFVPGQPLSDFFGAELEEGSAEPDVHGNQVGLLKRSRCYRLSATMTCSTCHDEHAPERPADKYSDRCLSCHRIEDCGLSKTLGHSIAKGCIGCHMPVLTSKAIFAETAGKVVRARMRTHWIRVYP
jgi:hypothetical protein